MKGIFRKYFINDVTEESGSVLWSSLTETTMEYKTMETLLNLEIKLWDVHPFLLVYIYNNGNSNKMKVCVENREFTIIVEEEPEGRGFSGQCKELPTAISQGKTLEELEENIKDAIQLVLDIQEDRF
jgi:predicted RNase H-like HicB family nuclease